MWKLLPVVLLFLTCESASVKESFLKEVTSGIEDDHRMVREQKDFHGFLRIHTDSMKFGDTIFIHNNDDSNFGFFTMKSKNEEPSFVGASKISIKAYFPDYYIVIMEANNAEGNTYEVKINSEVKYLNASQVYLNFETKKEHVQSSYLSSNRENPLRKEPSDSAQEETDFEYDNTFFEVLEWSGEYWAKVSCSLICEGCPPDNKNLTGWVKVINDLGEIIVDLHYGC